MLNHFDVFGLQTLTHRIRRNNKYNAITPFKVIQGQSPMSVSKAHMRLPISD